MGPLAEAAPGGPWKHWKLARDADGVAWLGFDKQKLGREHAQRGDARRTQFHSCRDRARSAEGPGAAFAEALGIYRRRRHQPVPRQKRRRRYRQPDQRPRHRRSARQPEISDRRGNPRLLPRRRAGDRARLRLPHRHRQRSAWISGSHARPASRPRRHGAAATADQSGRGDDGDADRPQSRCAACKAARPRRCGNAGAPRRRRREGCGCGQAQDQPRQHVRRADQSRSGAHAARQEDATARPRRKRRKSTTLPPMR